MRRHLRSGNAGQGSVQVPSACKGVWLRTGSLRAVPRPSNRCENDNDNDNDDDNNDDDDNRDDIQLA